MKFCLLIAAVSATKMRQLSNEQWPGAYRESNNSGVDVNYGHDSLTTPSLITANREMPAIAS